MARVSVAKLVPARAALSRSSRQQSKTADCEQSGFLYGQSPDSEQIELAGALLRKRNSGSREEIQDGLKRFTKVKCETPFNANNPRQRILASATAAKLPRHVPVSKLMECRFCFCKIVTECKACEPPTIQESR